MQTGADSNMRKETCKICKPCDSYANMPNVQPALLMSWPKVIIIIMIIIIIIIITIIIITFHFIMIMIMIMINV